VLIGGVITHFTSPRGTVLMSRVLYQRYWNNRQVTRALVRTVPGADIARSAAPSPRGSEGSTVYGFSRRRKPLITSPPRCAWHLPVRTPSPGIVLFVVLVGISDTLAAGVMERTREIGAIRVVGVARKQIRHMVLIEGLVLGILGLTLALMGGLALGTLWVEERSHLSSVGWSMCTYPTRIASALPW